MLPYIQFRHPFASDRPFLPPIDFRAEMRGEEATVNERRYNNSAFKALYDVKSAVSLRDCLGDIK
jgi:hypothetical protein